MAVYTVGVQVGGGGGGGSGGGGGVGVLVGVDDGTGVLVRVFVGRAGALVAVGGRGGRGGAGKVGVVVFVTMGSGVADGTRVLVGPYVGVTFPEPVGVGVLVLGVPGVLDAPGMRGVGVPVAWAMLTAVGVGGTQNSPTTTVPFSSSISFMNASSLILIGAILPYSHGR